MSNLLPEVVLRYHLMGDRCLERIKTTYNMKDRKEIILAFAVAMITLLTWNLAWKQPHRVVELYTDSDIIYIDAVSLRITFEASEDEIYFNDIDALNQYLFEATEQFLRVDAKNELINIANAR